MIRCFSCRQQQQKYRFICFSPLIILCEVEEAETRHEVLRELKEYKSQVSQSHFPFSLICCLLEIRITVYLQWHDTRQQKALNNFEHFLPGSSPVKGEFFLTKLCKSVFIFMGIFIMVHKTFEGNVLKGGVGNNLFLL